MLVNGHARQVHADDDTPLLYVLRNHLGLKGTRFGCGLSVCGACSVLVDGRPAYSCDTPLWSVKGKDVTTVEGLGTDVEPHPVARAIVEQQAAQCGYCMSGIVVSAAALLATNADPSESEVRAALDDNLCRCGAHNRVVRAVLTAAAEMRRAALVTTEALPPTLAANPRLGNWLRISSDGAVEIRSGKVELGQGVLTALAQVAAEELDVDVARIKMTAATTDLSPDEGLTAGSLSIQHSGAALRQVCAEVRDLYIGIAAEKLAVPKEELTIDDGQIFAQDGAATSYWELADDSLLDRPARAGRPAAGRPPAPSSWWPVRPGRQCCRPNGERSDGHVRPGRGDAEVIALASAQATRRAAPECWIERLPAVVPSSGLMPVTAAIIRDPCRDDVQFLGGHLGQRGEHALAELHLARTHLDHAARQHAQPVAEPRDWPRAMAAAPSWLRVTLPSAAVPAGPQARPRPRARRARSGSARRTGTGCRPARRGPRPRRDRRCGQQPGGADHHAGHAVAALRGLPVDDRPRDRMRLARSPVLRPSLLPCPQPPTSACHTSRPGGRRRAPRHAPHRPSPQPNRVPFSPRWFRSTYSSAVSRSVRTSSRWPFTSTATRMGSVSGMILMLTMVVASPTTVVDGPGI